MNSKRYLERDLVVRAVYEFMPHCRSEETAEQALKDVPDADVVERKKGKWIWDSDGIDWNIGSWVCSKCKGRPQTWWATFSDLYPSRCSGGHYCGNCGADMSEDNKVS